MRHSSTVRAAALAEATRDHLPVRSRPIPRYPCPQTTVHAPLHGKSRLLPVPEHERIRSCSVGHVSTCFSLFQLILSHVILLNQSKSADFFTSRTSPRHRRPFHAARSGTARTPHATPGPGRDRSAAASSNGKRARPERKYSRSNKNPWVGVSPSGPSPLARCRCGLRIWRHLMSSSRRSLSPPSGY
jgi:hypothetical protein